MGNMAIIIPALDPDEVLLKIIQKLQEYGLSRIVVVDDGSKEDCRDIFTRAEDLGCLVKVHEQTRGKGAALKTGMAAAVEEFGSGRGFVTADCDGQHTPEDIVKVADTLDEHPDSLILGARDLKKGDVPFRSRFGNLVTRVYFRFTTGVSCPDTQTGLRGIPACLEELALTEEGDRFEYEMNFLTDAVKLVPVISVPIRVIYRKGNWNSHFHPVEDSIRVYGRFLRFASVSVTSWLVDYLLFYLLNRLLGQMPDLTQAIRVFAAVVLARIVSGTINFTLNKLWSFRSKSPVGSELIRYLALFVSIMIASAMLTSLLSHVLPEMLAKFLVDVCLFFINFVVQENWVFRKDVSA